MLNFIQDIDEIFEEKSSKNSLKNSRQEVTCQRCVDLRKKLSDSFAENEKLKNKLNFINNRLKVHFEEDQIKALMGEKVSEWSEATLSKALALKVRGGNNVLDFVRKEFVPLPSSRTCNRHLENVPFMSGFQISSMKILAHKIAGLPREKRKFAIVMDEKAITPGMKFDPSSKTFIGKATIQTTAAHLKKNPEQIATHVLVFQLVGLNVRLKDILGYEFTAGATDGEALAEKLIQAIFIAENTAEVEVCLVGSDMGSDNVSMFGFLDVQINEKEQNHFFIHPHDASRKIYVKPDDVHNLKNIVNALRNHRFKISSSLVSEFNLSSPYAVFNDVIQVFNAQKKSTFKFEEKLTRVSMNPNHFEKMREKNATAIFTDSTIEAISLMNTSDKANPTAFVLSWLNKFHTIATSTVGWRKDEQERFNADMEVLTFLSEKFLPSLTVIAKNSQRKIYHRCISSSIVSIRCLIELSKFLFSEGAEIVIPSHFLTVSIENLFSIVVSRTKKPNAVEAKQSLRSISLSAYQNVLTNYNGSYRVEKNCPNAPNGFLQIIRDSIDNLGSPPVSDDPIFIADEEFDPETLFKNALEAKAFERETTSFIRQFLLIISCDDCTKFMTFLDNGEIYPTTTIKDYFLKLESLYRQLSGQINVNDDQFRKLFEESANTYSFHGHCAAMQSLLVSKFFVFRRKFHFKALINPEAARFASRSQF